MQIIRGQLSAMYIQHEAIESQKLMVNSPNHTVVYIPIFDGVQGSGANGVYHLAGWAAFVVTGGYLNGQGGGFKMASTISGRNYCSGSKRCIYGYFTHALIPGAPVPTDGSSTLPGVDTIHLTS